MALRSIPSRLLLALALFLAAPASADPYYQLYLNYYYQQNPRRGTPYYYFNYYYYFLQRYGQAQGDGAVYSYLHYFALEKKSDPPFWDGLVTWFKDLF